MLLKSHCFVVCKNKVPVASTMFSVLTNHTHIALLLITTYTFSLFNTKPSSPSLCPLFICDVLPAKCNINNGNSSARYAVLNSWKFVELWYVDPHWRSVQYIYIVIQKLIKCFTQLVFMERKFLRFLLLLLAVNSTSLLYSCHILRYVYI